MQSKLKKVIQYFGVLISLLYSCSASPDIKTANIVTPSAAVIIPTATAHPKSWKVIGVYNADQSIMTAGFLDELHVATGGVIGQMGYSSDAGKTWLVNSSMADCRYGMDIVSPQLIWSCGGATNVRRSMDGGQTWQMLAAFGDPHTIRGPCKSASFLDEHTGWLANPNLFGTTTNGGVSWTLRALPATANEIATIDTYLPGEGYLLDESGALFYTKDDGAHWTETSRVDFGTLNMSPTAYQLAAMRFSDAQHGLIVISSSPYGKDEPVLAFHTSDGGATWTSETVPVLAGPVYLARTGYLTVITGVNQLTLLKYGE
jgi:photosystem II stability/assembly factor-like uncharacterized protein